MKPLVRVLIVTDDWPGVVKGGFLPWTTQDAKDATGEHSREFHLGEFLSVLQNTKWVGFGVEITKAHRSQRGTIEPAADIMADRGADVVNFRFDQPFTVNGQARTLADYDMALLFAIEDGNPNPTFASEAEAIAQFMENGGGFFATGDHTNLGAPLCGLIPRVRSMRRWWSGSGPNGEPSAPPSVGPARHDTTQPGPDGVTHFEDQSDDVAQPILPTWYGAGVSIKQGYLAHKYLPHPLLCSPQGAITFLPDHMHEGGCEVPANLNSTFTLGGRIVREYPDYAPTNAPPGYVPLPLAPEIVATGHVSRSTTSPALDTYAHTGGISPTNEINFGVIGAWDGHRVGRGRVVVDSTWHHFFDINLTGDRYLEDESLGPQHSQKLSGFYLQDGKGGREPSPQYQMIQWYFRNLIYWLIPAGRQHAIWWHTLLDVSRMPRLKEELGATQEFQTLRLEHILYFGQLAEDYLSRARGSCATYAIKVVLYKPRIPWWEWIQEVEDVWDPIRPVRNNQILGDLRRDIVSGALGAGPQPDVMNKLTLGAAIVSLAMARRQAMSSKSEVDVTELAEKLLPDVVGHAAGLFAQQLKIGMESSERLLKAATAAQRR